MGTRAVSVLLLALMLGAGAEGVRAGEPKVYRWRGEDGREYTSNSPPPRNSVESCGRYGAWLSSWRDARQSVESWQAARERIQKRSDDFMRRSKSVYDASLARASQHLAEARERARRIEAEGKEAGVPRRCLD
jgi:hypothetical protein